MNITIEEIRKIVCDYFNIPEENIKSKTRKREIAECRQIAMYFCMKKDLGSSIKIGYLIGKKNHATCLHARKKIQNIYDTDRIFRNKIDEINNIIDRKELLIKNRNLFETVFYYIQMFMKINRQGIIKREAKRQYEQQIAFEQLSKMIDEEIKQII